MDIEIQELQASLSLAFTNFCQVANQLTPDQHNQPGVCGEWSPREVVAHLIGWDKSLHSFIVDPDNFDPPYDVHRFNAQSVASRQHLTWEETIHELETSFRKLEEAVSTVQKEMKPYPRVTGWMRGRRDDYDLHAGQLKAWLK